MHDVLIAGAGIVGAACAEGLARAGARVLVVDRAPLGGATAAGMGHLVVLEDDPATLAMTARGRALWEALRGELPPAAEFETTGTLWVAANEAEREAGRAKIAVLAAAGVAAEEIEPAALRRLEPALREGLAGGVLVPGDRVVYPPVCAEWWLRRAAAAGAELRLGPQAPRIAGVRSGGAALADGGFLPARFVVAAAGIATPHLLPEPSVAPVRPRKGHLVITERAPDFCRRQIVELGYQQSAHGEAARSIAFNVQPRATGQILIGSSRQYGATDPAVDRDVAAEMLRRAVSFLPKLRELTVLRAWTGFRPSTPDKLPLIGPVPGLPGVLLATGHEGLGITTAPFTAELIAHHVLGLPAPVSPAPYLPARFAS
jgi:glycine/D-amino acid oxidase-like deaminating enzyme